MDSKSIANRIEEMCTSDYEFMKWANSNLLFYRFYQVCRMGEMNEENLILLIKYCAEDKERTLQQLITMYENSPLPNPFKEP